MSRWLQETGGERGASYDEAFAALAASGADVHGEAAHVAALVPPGSRVLDAGCGTGRVAAELARRGYDVVGVDSDASMLAVAREKHPSLPWRQEDLAALEDESAYDLVVAAGNVVVFVTEGTGPEVVRRAARALRPGGLLVAGWRTDRAAPEDGPALPWRSTTRGPRPPASSRSRGTRPGTARRGRPRRRGAWRWTAARAPPRRRAARRRTPRARRARGRPAPRRGR